MIAVTALCRSSRGVRSPGPTCRLAKFLSRITRGSVRRDSVRAEGEAPGACRYDVQDDTIVMGVGVMTVRVPFFRRSMNLHIPAVGTHADAKECIQKIGPGVTIGCAMVDDGEGETVAGREAGRTGDAGFPDSVKDLFGDVRHLHEVLLPIGVDLIAEGDGCYPRGICKILPGGCVQHAARSSQEREEP